MTVEGVAPDGADASKGDLHIATVVVDVQEMERAVSFWCAALGYRPRENGLDADFVMLVDPKGEHIPLSLQLAKAAPAEPVRLHLDLYTDDQDMHVRRLLALGASLASDWEYPSDADFVVLRDPDGNEFCVIPHASL